MEVGSSVSLVDLLPGASTLPAELVAALDRESAVRDVAAGTVLLRQRAVVEDLMVLVRGRIATLVDFAGTGDLVVETTEQPGRVFGWSGLTPLGRATATVRADTDARFLTLPLTTVHHGPPAWTAALCSVVAGGLADRTHELQARSSRPAPGAPEGPGDA